MFDQPIGGEQADAHDAPHRQLAADKDAGDQQARRSSPRRSVSVRRGLRLAELEQHPAQPMNGKIQYDMASWPRLHQQRDMRQPMSLAERPASSSRRPKQQIRQQRDDTSVFACSACCMSLSSTAPMNRPIISPPQ